MRPGYRGADVHSWMLAASAVALACERVAYAVIWHEPHRFRRACHRLAPRRDPVDILAVLFVGFKVLQLTVFLAWCVVHGGSLARASASAWGLAIGGAMLIAGQALNLSVFARLGRVGVFYGNRLGRHLPWCQGFPFSVVRHPQYVGTVLSIWGFFVIMRHPAADWMALPLLETLYYAVGAIVEQMPVDAAITPEPSATAAGPRASRRLP
jgi:methylene-fatty-acyl-phospholipid synthase